MRLTMLSEESNIDVMVADLEILWPKISIFSRVQAMREAGVFRDLKISQGSLEIGIAKQEPSDAAFWLASRISLACLDRLIGIIKNSI